MVHGVVEELDARRGCVQADGVDRVPEPGGRLHGARGRGQAQLELPAGLEGDVLEVRVVGQGAAEAFRCHGVAGPHVADDELLLDADPSGAGGGGAAGDEVELEDLDGHVIS